MEKGNENNLRFFCPTHRIGFRSGRQTRIYCERGKHEFNTDFISGGNWIYCLDCQRFYPGKEDNKSNFSLKTCVACERKVERRFLCPECFAFHIEVSSKEKKEYVIKPEGFSAICPACQKVNGGLSLYLHNCRIIEVEFYTSLTDCPFCKSSIFGQEFANLQKTVSELKDVFWSVNSRVSRFERFDRDSEQALDKSKINSILDKAISEVMAAVNKKLDDFAKKVFAEIYKQKEEFESHIKRQNIISENNNKEFTLRLEELKIKFGKIESQNRERILLLEEKINNLNGQKQDAAYEYSGANTQFSFSGKIKDIFDRSPEKVRLVHYPLVNYALKQQSNDSETTYFFLINDQSGEQVKYFAIPCFLRISNEDQFRNYKHYYETDSKFFNGELEIIKPAKVIWDERIKGWRLAKVGLLKII